ncbi:MAG TPA: ribonuclease H-like domain-containing protein [Anoxybacillus sp.]|nr:ribonuclease H-like domain-containing protein [Anoxybacillus sp.]
MSIQKKLSRLKGYMSISSQSDDQKQQLSQQPNEKVSIAYLEQWESFGAKPFFFDGQYCFVRKVSYPLHYQHGHYQLGELYDVHRQWKHSRLEHPLSSKHHEVSDLFFFDTETTGLGSGAGNTIFLLGHARVLDDRVVVRQHFLPNPGAEVALYQSFLSEVDYTTLVTYNGKAFDWPVLKTRHTFIRDVVPKLPAFGHYDLYHASRRIWKYKLESVRLVNVEKEILGIERHEDIPGFLAPMLYFDFLSTQNPEGIFGVLKHNEIDVLSLIVLYIHLSKQILGAIEMKNAAEQFEMARWFDALGEISAAQETYERVAESNGQEAAKAKWNLSLIHKKEKRYEEAVAMWQELLQDKSDLLKIKAATELAKVYEHHFKKAEEAYTYALHAYEIWKSLVRTFKQKDETREQELLKRLHRLERKLKK